MALSRIGEQALVARVHSFLEATRMDIAEGRIEAVLARYARPLILVHDGRTDVLSDEAALRGHVARVAELSAEAREPIWRQEVVDIQALDRLLLSVTADVYRVDRSATPLPVVRQTLVLRRIGETFEFAAVVNPIRQETLHNTAPFTGAAENSSGRET